MPLKIKKKSISLPCYYGTHDLTAVFNTGTSVFINISNTSGAIGLIAMSINEVPVGTCEFDSTGFIGRALKLALVNTIRTLYLSKSVGETLPDNWSGQVVGSGVSLFKGVKKVSPEDMDVEQTINVQTSMEEHETAVLDAIKAECIGEESTGVVLLCKATKPYQQVRGTDGSSRYVFLTSHSGMKMAIRILSEGGLNSVKVSVRVECADGSIVSNPALTLMGLDTTSKGHASCHFQCITPEILERFFVFFKGCLAAWDLPAINIGKIKGLSV